MSNLEWDIYMAILRDRSDDPSVWARKKLQQMADRIHILTAERDEARRMWCENGTYTHPRQLAKEMRWDCYKEENK